VLEADSETFYERLIALKDVIPPQSRRRVAATVSTLTSVTKSSLVFSGKALWVISTSAFLLGVPWALAYAEEEQYVQMEKEQGMMRGANEVSFFFSFLNIPKEFRAGTHNGDRGLTYIGCLFRCLRRARLRRRRIRSRRCKDSFMISWGLGNGCMGAGLIRWSNGCHGFFVRGWLARILDGLSC
jgi:hypothetical protein